MGMMLAYYFFMKIVFFFGLVRAQIKSDMIRDHFLFLGILYTAVVAVLSYIFIFGWQQVNWMGWQVKLAASIGVSPWLSWIGQTFLLSTFYFWLMAKFGDTSFFWFLLIFGIALVFY